MASNAAKREELLEDIQLHFNKPGNRQLLEYLILEKHMFIASHVALRNHNLKVIDEGMEIHTRNGKLGLSIDWKEQTVAVYQIRGGQTAPLSIANKSLFDAKLLGDYLDGFPFFNKLKSI